MKDNVIQSQISLIAFKSTSLNYSSVYDENAKDVKPIFDLKLSNLLLSDNPNGFAKIFYVNLVIINTISSEVIKISTEFHTVFQSSQKIDTDFLNSDFARISAPAIGFPYLRAFISTLSLQGGVAPIILPSINFVQYKMNEDASQQK